MPLEAASFVSQEWFDFVRMRFIWRNNNANLHCFACF
jgi:hypothetical protein